MGVYLWTEDRENKAGYTFWKIMMAVFTPILLWKASKII